MRFPMIILLCQKVSHWQTWCRLLRFGKSLESVSIVLKQTDTGRLCCRLSFRENRIPLFPDKLSNENGSVGTLP